MDSLYLVFTIVLLLRVDCNPLTEVTEGSGIAETVTETNVNPLEEIQITTQNPLDLGEDTELITDTVVTIDYGTTDDGHIDEVTIINKESLPNQDCSNCLEAKYLNHYYAKGCKPVFDENCNNCPKKFDCSQKPQIIVLGNNECYYNGSKYRVGEAVPVDNPCKVCQCGYGFTQTFTLQYSTPFTTIHCITIECPEHFGVHRFPIVGLENDFEKIKNCYNVYEQNKCCAVTKKCLEPEKTTNEMFCEYNQKKYRIGEKIYPNENKCKVCICDENWDPNATVNNSGCSDVKCNIEIDRQLRDGCLPIYHESTCCPIDYYCGQEFSSEDSETCSQTPDSGPCVGEFKRFYYDIRDGECNSFVYSGCGGNRNNFRSLEDCNQSCAKFSPKYNESQTIHKSSSDSNSDNYCIDNDKKYEIGSKLDIGQRCVDCECRIPPDFTCIQKSCSNPSTNECKVTYSPNTCCPIFDCHYNKTNDKPFDPLSCPTPLCMKGCLFETYPDRCPNCVCEPSTKEQEVPDYDLSDVK